jgi:hypothetical protein
MSEYPQSMSTSDERLMAAVSHFWPVRGADHLGHPKDKSALCASGRPGHAFDLVVMVATSWWSAA